MSALPEPIRILSDLHLGYPGSLLSDAGQLRALIQGMGTVVFNGDSAELRSERLRPRALEELAKLHALCAQLGVQPVFINGNHDPSIGDCNHLDLAGGALLVTHGDALFEDIAPWSRADRPIGLAHRKLLEGLDEISLDDFETRLRVIKSAILSVGLPELQDRGALMARVAMFARECWPPSTPFIILRCWRQTPGLAAALARRFRPQARFVIIGHTHRSGITRVDPRLIINTGSYTPLLGRLAVDVAAETLTVRRVEGSRGFGPGKIIAQFPIAPLSAEEMF